MARGRPKQPPAFAEEVEPCESWEFASHGDGVRRRGRPAHSLLKQRMTLALAILVRYLAALAGLDGSFIHHFLRFIICHAKTLTLYFAMPAAGICC